MSFFNNRNIINEALSKVEQGNILNSAMKNYLDTVQQLDQMYFCLKKVALFNKFRNFFAQEKISNEFSISILFIGYVSAYENFSKNVLVKLIERDFFDLNNEEYREILTEHIPNRISPKQSLNTQADFKQYVLDKIKGLTWNKSSKNMDILADLVGKKLNINLYQEFNIDEEKLEKISEKIIKIRDGYVHNGGEGVDNIISFDDLEMARNVLVIVVTEQYIYLSNNVLEKLGFRLTKNN